ncbi:unnamed protein product [Rotaria sordida]|uniref:F-box domain-containing protein n=1 Tax=Rotaria sordida TaxID=392033 RepID=A0A819DCD7_9BILA|nr:unnamed protein product [Rotaria sordida]CAF3831332.1 unnamed protein product [Rotaria sordida]
MNDSNSNNINILDLPNEILLTILSTLNMIDVLYSLVDVNTIFNRLIFDSHYIHHLNLTANTLLNDLSSVENEILIFDRIHTKILPRIHDKHFQLLSGRLLKHPTFNLAPEQRIKLKSLSLIQLKISVNTIDDCLYLLDEDLKCLSTLIIDINEISDSSYINNTGKLPKLKCFSLISHNDTYVYDKKIVPLLCRMSNLEELTLFLKVIRTQLPYIDGTHLFNDILINMLLLNKFTFSINTHVLDGDVKIDLPTNNDIQNSFIKIGYKQVDSYVDVNLSKIGAKCHVYSLPYEFDTFFGLTNSFRRGNFDKVRCLTMHDIHPFEHDYFKIISQDFPFLQKLTVINSEPQKNKQHSSTLITFAQLNELYLMDVHIDYVEQFLFETNTRLPRLNYLTINYEPLAIVTNNFMNDAARFNCSQLRNIYICEPFVRPENFHSYFTSLICWISNEIFRNESYLNTPTENDGLTDDDYAFSWWFCLGKQLLNRTEYALKCILLQQQDCYVPCSSVDEVNLIPVRQYDSNNVNKLQTIHNLIEQFPIPINIKLAKLPGSYVYKDFNGYLQLLGSRTEEFAICASLSSSNIAVFPTNTPLKFVVSPLSSSSSQIRNVLSSCHIFIRSFDMQIRRTLKSSTHHNTSSHRSRARYPKIQATIDDQFKCLKRSSSSDQSSTIKDDQTTATTTNEGYRSGSSALQRRNNNRQQRATSVDIGDDSQHTERRRTLSTDDNTVYNSLVRPVRGRAKSISST